MPETNDLLVRRLDNGRVYFTATGLFTASFSLTGPEATDKWYIVDLEFLVGIGSAAKERFLSSESKVCRCFVNPLNH